MLRRFFFEFVVLRPFPEEKPLKPIQCAEMSMRLFEYNKGDDKLN